MSDDGTFEIVQKQKTGIVKAVREPDEGLYDALNKGIQKATGEIIGFLHADDLLADSNVIAEIGKTFANKNIDSVYGDLVYTSQGDTNKVVRYWKSGQFNRDQFRRGWMPPHPTFYLRKERYEQFGLYRTDLGTAADYELLLRMLYRHELRVEYIPKILVKMRTGGASNVSWSNRLRANDADRNAWITNGLQPPRGIRFSKPLRKIKQYFDRP